MREFAGLYREQKDQAGQRLLINWRIPPFSQIHNYGIMSYKNLEIWQQARTLSVDIHNMTLTQLPKFEMYEEGSQIRRSAKSIRSNIVEGYGRRRYKQDYIRYLTYAHASSDETKDHLETLFETGSLKDQHLYTDLMGRLRNLGRNLYYFIQSVEQNHNAAREANPAYIIDYEETSQ